MNKRMIFKKIENKYVEKLENTIKSKDAEIEFLKQQIALMKEKEFLAKHKLFGSSSEKVNILRLNFLMKLKKNQMIQLQSQSLRKLK